MNILFFASSQFALPSLKSLMASGHKVLCVITQPDRHKGRGLHIEGTAIKTAAQQLQLYIFQPERINSEQSVSFLKGLKPDLSVVISYGQILSREILETPKIMSINAHASLLPKYRGAAPINWAIIRGEKTTGVTIMKMFQEMDAGPIISQKELAIGPDDSDISLEDKLSILAAKLLLETLRQIENNKYKLTPQDEKKITFARKLKKEDGLINWEMPAFQINNLVRGCLRWPGAFTYYNGKLLKIYRTTLMQATDCPAPAGCQAGEVIEAEKGRICVATGDGVLAIEELQIEGKRQMKAQEFIAGHKIQPGEVLRRI
jgi:methionyl-tRNA formyltransferase